MRRFLAALVLSGTLVALSGSAQADVFRVLPSTPIGLPSAQVPNLAGDVTFPADLSVSSAAPETLSFGQLEALWQQAGNAYGVPWQVLAAINKVESNFGRNMGPSSAGAVGWMQFMPSTWERWGVDANGDGVADPWNSADAIYAAARYLAASGGATDINAAVFSYNHAQWYVDEVMQLARVYGAGGTQVTFQLDRTQQSIDAARNTIVRVNRTLVAAELVERGLVARVDHWTRRADGAQLLSARLALQKRAVQLDVVRSTASARVLRLRKALRRAQADLASARVAQTQTTPFTPAASGAVLDAPSYDSGYVFPVGGGPSVVSVAHTHHDYPAADIAAPEGSPAYALADAVVLRSWSLPDPRCGIGLTMQTSDGQTWTYCHLAYLEPSVTRGAVLSAGAPIGLVGHTGDATGPHLHLQLDPQSRYPQSEAWFQNFAGVAFRWQDAATPSAAPPASPGPVFAVVPSERSASASHVIRFTR